jgi:hypothetical protein
MVRWVLGPTELVLAVSTCVYIIEYMHIIHTSYTHTHTHTPYFSGAAGAAAVAAAAYGAYGAAAAGAYGAAAQGAYGVGYGADPSQAMAASTFPRNPGMPSCSFYMKVR